MAKYLILVQRNSTSTEEVIARLDTDSDSVAAGTLRSVANDIDPPKPVTRENPFGTQPHPVMARGA